MDRPAVELIIARNLVSALELAALIVDPDDVVVFFNDAAGDLFGRRFEEVGPLRREEWNARFGPFDEQGRQRPKEELPLTVALRDGAPANARVHLRMASGELEAVELSALPLVTSEGFAGAVVAFWRADGHGE